MVIRRVFISLGGYNISFLTILRIIFQKETQTAITSKSSTTHRATQQAPNRTYPEKETRNYKRRYWNQYVGLDMQTSAYASYTVEATQGRLFTHF